MATPMRGEVCGGTLHRARLVARARIGAAQAKRVGNGHRHRGGCWRKYAWLGGSPKRK